jgi:hypothetical protein
LKATERYEQVYDVFDFIVKARPIAFERGAWREKSLKDTVAIDFGPRFGTRPAATVSMPELHALPEQLGLEELAIFAASPNPVVDYVVKKLIMGLHRVRPRLGWRTLAWLIFWMTQRMAQDEPSGFSNVLEARGERGGQERTMRIVVDHEDNYYATGVTVTSFLRQYFSGDFKELTGVRMMGHIIDPEPALQDLQRMGVTVTREEY